MSHPLRHAASLLALAFAAAPASAATILISFSGAGLTVSEAGAEDAAASVTGSILIDTDRLPPDAAPGQRFDYEADNAPFLTTMLTFSGDDRPFFAGQIASTNVLRDTFGTAGQYELSDQRVLQSDDSGHASASLYLNYFGVTGRQVVDGFTLPIFAVGQDLDFALQNNSDGFDSDGNPFGRSIATFGTVRITGVSQAGGPGAVPEPATWGTMVLGFGLVGAAVRRRRTPSHA